MVIQGIKEFSENTKISSKLFKKKNEYSLAFEFDKMIKYINNIYKPKKSIIHS